MSQCKVPRQGNARVQNGDLLGFQRSLVFSDLPFKYGIDTGNVLNGFFLSLFFGGYSDVYSHPYLLQDTPPHDGSGECAPCLALSQTCVSGEISEPMILRRAAQ